MRTIDRITLIVLTLGLWALVLLPRSIETNRAHAAHHRYISGIVDGQIDLDGKFSIDASEFSVRCDHRVLVKTCGTAGCVGTYVY